MGQPYVGEIRLFAGNFAPVGWMFCDGQLLAISEYETLFMLIGTTYGGDGEMTFALPDLRGRVPIHMGTGSTGTTYMIGEPGGVEDVTLSVQQIPSHSHQVHATDAPAFESSPRGLMFARPLRDLYAKGGTPVPIDPIPTLANGYATQAHSNMQPSLSLSFIISLYGIFPTPT